jgi:hypothetical protein
MASFIPSEAYSGAQWNDYGGALWNEDPPLIPSVGGYWPNHRPRQVTPLDEIEEHREAERLRRAAVIAASVPGAPRLPTGNKDLMLLTAPAGEDLKRRPLITPFYRRSWFLPVVIFGVVLGVVSSSREER